MLRQELITLWAQHFDSPFPDASYFFWKRYDAAIVTAGLRALASKSQTHTFSTLADACRFATAVMRIEKDNATVNAQPAPVVRAVPHV
jgi:hypothetical protein